MTTEPTTVSVLVIPEPFRHMEQIAGKMAQDRLRAVVQLREPGHAHTLSIHSQGFDIVESCNDDGDHSAFCATATAYRYLAARLDARVEAMDPLTLAVRHAVGRLDLVGNQADRGFENFGFDLYLMEGWLLYRTYPVDAAGNLLTVAELLAEEG